MILIFKINEIIRRGLESREEQRRPLGVEPGLEYGERQRERPGKRWPAAAKQPELPISEQRRVPEGACAGGELLRTKAAARRSFRRAQAAEQLEPRGAGAIRSADQEKTGIQECKLREDGK